jgi:tRNA pseudouridine55 synthase
VSKDFQDKIIAVNKPKGPTSNDILTQIKKKLGMKKGVGHAGTLDPLASGVLVVGIGKATKKLNDIVKKEKEYQATIRLGMNSETDDAEGEKTQVEIEQIPSLKEIKKVLPKFIGVINQVPPIYSAVKIQGKEAYKRVRSGERIELKEREVNIKSIEVIKYQWPYLDLKVITGPGVYIRSLARDIGKELKTGGYISELVRTRVGQYNLEEAVTIEDI